MKLEDYLAKNNLNADPFAHTNADEEELLAEYFVPPPYFADVRGLPSAPKSCVVFAPRGGGKTAQRRMLELDSQEDDSQYLCVLYDRFMLGRSSVEDHINQICLRLTVAELISLERDDIAGLGIPERDRDFLIGEASLLDEVSRDLFDQIIRSLKSDTRRMGDWLRDNSGPVKAVVAGLLAKRGLELDPTLPWGPQMTKAREIPGIARLERHVEFAKSIGFDSVYVLVDRLDETAATTTNPKATIELVADLLLDLKIMELPGLAIKAFVWNLSRDHYSDLGGRSDRIREYSLTWSATSLDSMMSRRLEAFSDGRLRTLNDLLASGESIDLQRVATFMANGSPRDMVRFCGRVVSEHLNSGDLIRGVMEVDVWRAVTSFSSEIAEDRAKKFLPDLLRLDRYRFTQNLVANDYLKISKQATGAKVTEWRRTGMIDKIAEVQDKRLRPQHLYAITDARLAVALRPNLEPQDVLEYFSFECPHCRVINFCDESKFDCSGCQRPLLATSAPSLMSLARR